MVGLVCNENEPKLINAGRKMKFRQFRGDEELPWPANDDTYDFEYQQTRLLKEEITIYPGDQLTMGTI
jgi:hypothetical protein